MSAPALVIFSPEAHDERGVRTIVELTRQLREQRPDIAVQPALPHDVSTIVDHLVDSGHAEIVIVPAALSLSDPSRTNQLVHTCAHRHPDASIVMTDPIGVNTTVFGAVDAQLRTALSRNRIRELDALVLACPGSRDTAVNAALTRAARAWGKHHNLPTTAAFSRHVPPAASEAVRAHRLDGRRHIAVASLFLTANEFSDHVNELGYEAGASAVSEPLGSDPRLTDVILSRYGVGSLTSLPLDTVVA